VSGAAARRLPGRMDTSMSTGSAALSGELLQCTRSSRARRRWQPRHSRGTAARASRWPSGSPRTRMDQLSEPKKNGNSTQVTEKTRCGSNLLQQHWLASILGRPDWRHHLHFVNSCNCAQVESREPRPGPAPSDEPHAPAWYASSGNFMHRLNAAAASADAPVTSQPWRAEP
jgi:hypothetical protein